MSEEQRIKAHYKARRATWNPHNGSIDASVFMPLARRWKRSIAEIKNIVEYKGRTDWVRIEPPPKKPAAASAIVANPNEGF